MPNPSRETFTLPRQATAPNITITDKQKTDKQTSETEQKAVGKQTPDKADVNKCVHGNGISKNKRLSLILFNIFGDPIGLSTGCILQIFHIVYFAVMGQCPSRPRGKQ